MTDIKQKQKERYHRHLILRNFGEEGQKKLLNSKILVIGVGGLGSPVLLYLAAAGVGTIGIADDDVVDVSNLQRQIIHFTTDVNLPKVDSAEQKINALNPDVTVIKYHKVIDAENILETIKKYHFVIDCTDNFSSKFLINDACVMAKIPYSHGGVMQYHGQTLTVIPDQTACYRCVYNEPPPADSNIHASEIGILGVIPGILGTIQAAEAIKHIAGVGNLLTNALMTFNAETMNFQKIKLKKQKACPLCGEKPSITSLSN